MIGYTCGSYDILRAKDLQDLDMQIQLSKQNGNKFFGLGIYDENLCERLGLNSPLKSLEDRMEIVEHLRGVDFVFPVHSLDENLIAKTIGDIDFYEIQNAFNKEENKRYNIGYAPGTYDLFHKGHLENLLEASKNCKKLIVGIKSNDLVQEHKGRKPILSALERMEILRHFNFVYDTYIYYTRDPHIANDWIKSKYGEEIGAIFVGSDLENDFKKYKDLNIIYTERDKEIMKKRSTTAYAKKYRSLKFNPNPESKKYTGHINISNKKDGFEENNIKSDNQKSLEDI